MEVSYWGLLAVGLLVFRYLRLVVNLISHWTFRPTPIPAKASFSSQDVTVIIPAIDGDSEELRRTIRSCLTTEPYEIIVVTIDGSVKAAQETANTINSRKVRVLSISKANKRSQMCRAIPEVKTAITIFADDDVIWPRTLMPWILAPFEDSSIGGVGTSQRLIRSANPSIWSFLGSLYLERRNFDCSACLHIDGGLPCLSGRTVAYRTSILQDDTFTFGFTHETWGTYQLNADDDNFITRWMFTHGWKIAMQYHKAAEIQTTLEEAPKYLKQCLRWVRSNWRSNITSMFVERNYWRTHPWTSYAVFQTTLTAWAFTDPLMFYVISKSLQCLPDHQRRVLLVAAAIWIFVIAKSIKLLGHFIRYPADFVYLPISIAFGYVHGTLKLIGLLTLSETAWGSREGADTDDRYRMIRLPPYSHDGSGVDYIFNDDQDQLPDPPSTQLLPPYDDGSTDPTTNS